MLHGTYRKYAFVADAVPDDELLMEAQETDCTGS